LALKFYRTTGSFLRARRCAVRTPRAGAHARVGAPLPGLYVAALRQGDLDLGLQKSV